MIKIGYQGIENSYSHIASLQFVKKLNIDAKVIGLISSQKVIEELINGNIDYGVVAIKNSIAGKVEETKNALDKINYQILDSLDLEIHHCLFKLKEVNKNDIKYIASHIQALKQTERHIKDLFNNIEVIGIEDTSLSALLLKNNKIPKDTAVICSMKAGLSSKLDLIRENIEDEKNNTTTFIMIKKNN